MSSDRPSPNPLSPERLESLLDRFPERRIGLIGDLFLDRYLMIEPGVRELSIETGLEAYQVTEVRNSPGALGTVLSNLAALGVGYLLPLAVIGNDGQGDDLIRRLQRLTAVDHSQLIRSDQRLTPTYTKPMRRDEQGVWRELNRLDIRDRRPLNPSDQARLCERLDQHFAEVDGWIVLDQIVEPDWGVVNRSVRDHLRRWSQRDPERFLFVDSRQFLAEFDFGVLKCNRDELARQAGDDLETSLHHFAQRTGRTAFCTLGDEGIIAVDPAGERRFAPAIRVDGPVDIVGAGDAATSAIVAASLSGGSPLEACQLANLTASITIQKLGETGSASPAELREAML